MYPTTLNTNEVKNSAGVEVEFQRLSTSERQLVFSQIAEVPSQPHRLSISHQESGSGVDLKRSSVLRIDKTIQGQVDTARVTKIEAYVVVRSPIGQLTSYAEVTNVVAELMSTLASKGASTTILYDGTGYGAEALINGSL